MVGIVKGSWKFDHTSRCDELSRWVIQEEFRRSRFNAPRNACGKTQETKYMFALTRLKFRVIADWPAVYN